MTGPRSRRALVLTPAWYPHPILARAVAASPHTRYHEPVRSTSLALLTMAMVGAMWGCERSDPPPTRVQAVAESAAPTTVATPSGAPTQAPSEAPPPLATATASASASAAALPELPAAQGLLAPLVAAAEIKVTRLEGDADLVVTDAKAVRAVLDAIGMAQKPADACPGGLQVLSLSFKDRFGTRLGSLALFRDSAGALRREAAIRDALGDRCHTVELADPDGLAKQLGLSAPTKEEGSP